MTMTPTSTANGPSGAAAPLPRYRGLRGAVTKGLLDAGIGILVSLLLGAVIYLLTGAVASALWMTARFALCGAVLGAGEALSLWICGWSSDRLLSLRHQKGFQRGWVGLCSLFLGLILAGYLSQATGAGPEGHETLAVGQTLEIAGPTLDGGRFDLAEHRGKLVLVDFWATWCGPCIAELPNLRAAYERYHAEGVEIVSVSLDFRREALLRFLQAQPLPWPQIFFDPQETGGENPLSRRYGIDAIPCLLLVDREGKVAATDLRGEEIQHAIAESLGQTVPWPWHAQVARVGFQLLRWFFSGVLNSPWWLLVPAALGGALSGAAIEAVLRRLCRRPATFAA